MSRSKKICLFNHKGGVSKTTTAFNLAWMLAEKKKRVLLVDADSQCNLTNIFLTEEYFEDHYEQHPKQNIKEFLSPAFDGLATPIKAADCLTNKRNSSLFLIPGSFDLSEYDVSLGLSFSASQAITSIKNLPGAFNNLIEKTARKYETDYTIIDLNPSLSAMNQTALLSSDFFIIPATPDFFSVMAIRSLARAIPRWEEWASQYARNAFKDSIYPFPKRTPLFLGTLIQRFSITGTKKANGDAKGERVPSHPNQNIIDAINETVKESLVPELKKAQMLLPSVRYPKDYCIAKIQDFHSLNACYQQFGVPVFALNDDQLKSIKHGGQALKNDHGIIAEVKKRYEEICGMIVKETECQPNLRKAKEKKVSLHTK